MAQLVASPFSVPRKLISILFVFGFLTFSLLFLQTWHSEIDLANFFAERHDRNTTELSLEADRYLSSLIRTYNLSPRVEWAAWNIIPTQSQNDWKSVTRVPRRFQPREPRIFDQRHRASSPAAQTFPTLTLPSPQGFMPGQFDASGYLFGVSTTYERLMADDRAMLRGWQFWLTDGGGGGGKSDGNGAHVVVMLDRADDEQIALLERQLGRLGITAMVYNADEPLSTATRYAQLAGELHAYGSALSAVGVAKKWFVLLDDAVFFPSLSHLDQRLAAYDARESVYVGVPSEREDWSVREDGALSTTGGGVVVLSRGGMRRYLSLSCDETDSSSESFFHARQWASALHECLTGRGQLPMQVIHGLYEPAAADPESSSPLSEQLESGARPVALRTHVAPDVHLASAYLVADQCGEACFAQRFLFRDNWVLVNGVSISQYQHPLKIQKAEQLSVKRRFDAQLQLNDASGGASNRSGSGRLHLAGGGARNVWRLLDSTVDDYGVVWQAYVKRELRDDKRASTEEEEQIDSVIILWWNSAEE